MQFLEATHISERRALGCSEPATESMMTLKQLQGRKVSVDSCGVCSANASCNLWAKPLSKVKVQSGCFNVIMICTKYQSQILKGLLTSYTNRQTIVSSLLSSYLGVYRSGTCPLPRQTHYY